MNINILTLFPDMFSGFVNESIIMRAQQSNLININIIDIRDFAKDKHKKADDPPYGGGAGMVMMIEPIVGALRSLPSTGNKKIILTSARGIQFNQQKAQQLSTLDHMTIIAGHYEGIDNRIQHYIDEEISIGDYILTGGELPAAVISDVVIRLLPGVLSSVESTKEESFFTVQLHEVIKIVGLTKELEQLRQQGTTTIQLLEYPHYTRPERFENQHVPEVLLSGHHKAIREWRIRKAYEVTLKNRPDLLHYQ